MPHSTAMEAISTQQVKSSRGSKQTRAFRIEQRARKTDRQEDVMKTRKAILSLVALSLMFCSSMLAQQAPDNVAGDWTIYSTNIENGETVVKHVQITQSGNQLSGFFEGPVQSGPIQGEIHGNYIRFSTVTKTVLNFGGHVYGDRMSGSYGLHGKHAAWQAVRTTPVAETADPVTGTVYAYQPVLAAPAPPPAPGPPTSSPQTTVPDTQNNSAPAPLSADQLDALVAPIALDPDALVAQVLAAATNPDQVAYANDWLAQNKGLTGTALVQSVDQQSWDPSVKALTQFPSVLDNLAHNLSWTSSLGQAFANQQGDVMAAVQTMRAKAQAAGSLQSNSQITVTTPSSNTIVIQPANPQVVYVPQYNPAAVYGSPVVVPLYVPPPVPVASVGLYFGTGVAVGVGGWGGGWGWHAWNVNWGGGGSTIIYNNNTYINNRTWNNAGNNGYRPGTDTHYGPNGAYHPNGYYGPNGGWHPDGSVNHAGGATGSENSGYYANNGSYHPAPGYQPGTDTHYGPNGAYHPDGYYGPHGAYHTDVPGTNPQDQPNGGNNGNHGLIGGNGGTQHATNQNLMGSSDKQRSASGANEHSRSPMSGNGNTARAEANRGRSSMAARRAPQQHVQRASEHAPAMHEAHGGGGERRR